MCVVNIFIAVPTVPNDPNHILVVGNIMGQIGVVTWNGYDTHQQGQNNEGNTMYANTFA